MNPFRITEDGDIDIETGPGDEYMLVLKGDFAGATVTMTSRSDIDNTIFESIDDGAFTAAVEMPPFLAPSKLTRFTTTDAGAGTDIRVVFFPRQAKH